MIIKLSCSKCGSQKGCTPDRLEKLVIKNGPDKVLKEYLCRGCRKGQAPVNLEAAVAAVLAKINKKEPALQEA